MRVVRTIKKYAWWCDKTKERVTAKQDAFLKMIGARNKQKRKMLYEVTRTRKR